MSKESHFLFYSTEISESKVLLDNFDTKHLTKVLRASVGERVLVTDGQGSIYRCEIEDISEKTILKIEKRESVKRVLPQINLYVGMPNKDNFEKILYSVIPLGVSKIIPMITEFTQKPWWKGWEKQSKRFEKIAVTAIKQSHNPYLPEILAPVKFEKSLETLTGTAIYLDMNGEKITNRIEPKDGVFSLLIGPPGGFSTAEENLISNRGAVPVTVSPFRLRTEVAAASAVAIVASF